MGKLNRQTIEDLFKKFKPLEEVVDELPFEENIVQNEAGSVPKEKDMEVMIKDIIDMFPHLGDGLSICSGNLNI